MCASVSTCPPSGSEAWTSVLMWCRSGEDPLNPGGWRGAPCSLCMAKALRDTGLLKRSCGEGHAGDRAEILRTRVFRNRGAEGFNSVFGLWLWLKHCST